MSGEWRMVLKEYSSIFEDHWRTLYRIPIGIMSLAWPAYVFGEGRDFDHKFALLLMSTVAILAAAIAHQSPGNMNRRNLISYRWNKSTAIENTSLAIATCFTVYVAGRFLFELAAKVLNAIAA